MGRANGNLRGSRRGALAPLLAVATAAGVTALASFGAVRMVDGSFRLRYRSVDFARPAEFFSPAGAVGSSDVGRGFWVGTGRLVVRLGEVRPGDVAKVKLRAHERPCAVALFAGARQIAVVEAGPAWREEEGVSTSAGGALVLAPAAAPCPLHLSRLTLTNVAAHSSGTFPVFVRHLVGPRSRGETGRWTAGLPVLLGLAVMVWRRRARQASLGSAAAAAAWVLLPAAGLAVADLALAWGWHLGLVVPPRTFVLVLSAPVAVAGAIRGRAVPVATVVALLRSVHALAGGLLMSVRGTGAPRALRRVGAAAAELAHRCGFDAVGAGAAADGTLGGRQLQAATTGFSAVLAVAGVVFAALVVQDFGAPLTGRGDLSQWEQQNAYVSRNLTFTPLPRLDLHNDQLFYPYGGNNVFQPWIFEMHLLVAAATRLFGPWGWCQLYYLLTVLVTALGAFLLLVRDHGAWRAGLAALAVAFCGYYAIGKYAGQLAVACVHWTVLAILADAVLVARMTERRPWSARLLLLRVFLLFACLGLELGYVAGLGLTSALLSGAFVALLLLDRAGWRLAGLRTVGREMLQQLLSSAHAHPLQVVALAGATLAAAFFYLPLAAQVAAAAREFHFAEKTSFWWANPVRLLLPILPGFDPVRHAGFLHDQPEGAFAASPGVAFVLAALAGLVAGRRRILAGLPALSMLALLLSFHPLHFASLRLLPWFAFARVTGRFSVVYPVLLVSLALLAPARSGRRGALAFAALVVVLGVEAGTAYRLHLMRPWRFPRSSPEFIHLVNVIREAPGEAILDWPFCVAGGNGVGTGLLCSFYGQQCGIASLQAYHGKKIVGAYFGRLHPQQIQPYLAAGWPRLFLPDDRSPWRARRQRRDFAPEEWAFLERFVRLGDFSGVLLYLDLLPPETVAGFHARFGSPVAAATTLYGRVEFIPKPAAWRTDTDVAGARRLALPPVPPLVVLGRPVAMGALATDDFLGQGWGGVWKGRRTTLGYWAELRFRNEVEGPCTLCVEGSTFRVQRVLVRVNGTLVAEWRHDGGVPRVFSAEIPADVLKRDNVVRFELPDARTPKSLGLNDDERLLGLTVAWFRLDPVAPAASSAVSGGGHARSGGR